jgi:hypothetical protein
MESNGMPVPGELRHSFHSIHWICQSFCVGVLILWPSSVVGFLYFGDISDLLSKFQKSTFAASLRWLEQKALEFQDVVQIYGSECTPSGVRACSHYSCGFARLLTIRLLRYHDRNAH